MKIVFNFEFLVLSLKKCEGWEECEGFVGLRYLGIKCRVSLAMAWGWL